jgi:hypothetical protein
VVARRLPAARDHLGVLVREGTSLETVANRRRGTRGTSGTLLGRTVLPADRPRDGRGVDRASDPAGETTAAERIPDRVPRRRARGRPAELPVGDRRFGPRTHVAGFTREHRPSVARHARTRSFDPDPERDAVTTQESSRPTVTGPWGDLLPTSSSRIW